MAKEMQNKQGVVKKPPKTSLAAPDAVEKMVKKPAKPAAAKVKETPAGGATSPVSQDTVATEPPETGEGPMPAAKKPASDPPAGGEKAATALGDYKLIKKLGQGGMGAVYKAQHTGTGDIVALKVLSKELAAKGNFVQRFLREARAMEKLDHPNVLRSLGTGNAKGFHFLAMEIVDGGSIEGWLKKLGKFSVGDGLHIIMKTCEAMQHAHEKSIIHRDIKPDNILITKEGVIKVADLGLAKDTDEDVSLTKTGAGAGTPIYMAPEQARDVKHVDVRVDIYALGVMLYVLLTGRAPFEGNTLVELISAKEKGKFDPMRRHNDEVPSQLDLIVDKMIAKDPKFRYASCQEVLDALEPLGLHHEELSFLAADVDKTMPNTKRPAKPTPTKVPSKPAGKGMGKTAAPNKGGQKTAAPEPEEIQERDVWYWKMVTPEGKIITKKLSTDQMRTLIKAGQVDPPTDISKTPKTGFRGAATYPEFQGAFKAREAATKANAKGAKYRNKFQEIEAQDARRRRWGWLTRGLKGVGGTLFGLFWIVLILGIVGAGGYLLWEYVLKGM